jgi:NADPH:quinone reductase
VRRLKVGDKVYASFDNSKGGFYAEYVAVPAASAASVTDGLDLKHAGAIATTGLTAPQEVDDALQTRSGDSLIIHGASGGVGTLAVQFAKARGARVLATASGADGVALVQQLGADLTVDGHDENVLAAARDFAPTEWMPCLHLWEANN